VIRITPLILAVALFMENMDSTVIATSLPAIAADIGTSPIALKLALTSYFVSLAIFIPISGWMADRYGSTSIFRIAIGVFVIGSIACAFSNSLETFVISRFLQGLGGSMMTPVARLVLLRSTPRNELVNAMAWLTVPALIGPLTGPPIGGFLTTYLTWHWIFWINVPIGLVGIVLATRFRPGAETRTPRPVDGWGFALTSVAFSGIIFGLSVISLPAIPIGWGFPPSPWAPQRR
jgi:MFS family permease